MASFYLQDFKIKNTLVNIKLFTERLLEWWSSNKRDLPWKYDKDPYKIWLSEIILQQTRVEQGLPYYLNFIETFPDIQALAAASTDQVMKCWHGLGYYSRARNLHHTAQQIVEKFMGNFPNDYHNILKLKGVGPYTAAAISSFAYELPYPVVDGNVIRLISRINGISEPVDIKATQQKIYEFVNLAINHAIPSHFNQALMDFGATVCLPKNPKCTSCPMQEYCWAYKRDEVEVIPVKSKKIQKATRYFHYFEVIDSENKTVLKQRTENDIWRSLYDFPLIETQNEMIPDPEIIKKYLSELIPEPILSAAIVKHTHLKQVLTHRIIEASFYKIILNHPLMKIKNPYCLVDRQKVSNFAFPKVITSYISMYGV